jgi:hypothetical protein
VLLATNLVENATATDVLVPRGESGAAFDLLVETDLPGMVWSLQLGAVIATLPSDLTAATTAMSRGADGAAAGLTASRFGLPARDERDPRWQWKLDELAEMRALSGDCSRQLLDERARPTVVDPVAVKELVATAMSFESLDALVAISVAVDEAGAVVPRDSLTELSEALYDSLTAVAGLGPDLAAVVGDMLQPGLRSESLSAMSGSARLSRGRRGKGDLDASLAGAVRAIAGEEGTYVEVLTDSAVWRGVGRSGWSAPHVMSSNGQRFPVKLRMIREESMVHAA